MKTKTILLIAILFLMGSIGFSQNTRIKDANNIGWYNYFGTFKLTEKYSIHSEYQWRRDNYIADKQQGLLRVGLNYQANKKLQLRLGYAWIETYPYGEIPINSFGKDFTEHRIFQMATLTDKVSIVDISHRLMLEQRWVGRYSNSDFAMEDEFPLLNRFRYMFRVQFPLRGNIIQDKTPYLAMYNELFVGFGKNVNENIFDQNRIGILLGYRFNNSIKIEGGYLNQIIQFGREINNKNVFQYNNGFIVNTILNFDLTTNKKVQLNK